MAENMEEITPESINELINHFSKNTYRAKEECSEAGAVLDICKKLLSLDYNYTVINNSGGELSAHYPSQILILNYENTNSNSNSNPLRNDDGHSSNEVNSEDIQESNRIRDLFQKAKLARCRSRFPLPVILYQGKHICRSSTLSGGAEIYGRSGLNYFFSSSSTDSSQNNTPSNLEKESTQEETAKAEEAKENDRQKTTTTESHSQSSDWLLFGKVRRQDIRLLKYFHVDTIIDFMVEKKKVKFGMNVTSSEKVDKENRYSDFNVISLPYPGCEFFRAFRDNDYVAEGLVFDWTQAYVDASIGVHNDPIAKQLRIDWENYKRWDLITLTQNYMKLILLYLQEKSKGLLIHCISGWDRTPLFISLLRLSLWADGVIHPSLNPVQILYFTVAYDWLLFGHNLQDRISKGEDIFFFCFYFLKHIEQDEYSINSKNRNRQSSCMHNDSEAQIESVLLEETGAVHGSNMSLNSTNSSMSNKSQETPPTLSFSMTDSEETANGNTSVFEPFLTSLSCANPEETSPPHYNSTTSYGNGNSPASPNSRCSQPPNRTSPVAVPVTNRLRQRNESTSSLSTGSWQMISTTGSLRGSASACDLPLIPITTDGPVSNESSTTLTDDDCFIYNQIMPDSVIMRRDKLEKVRYLFYQAYCSTVGMKFKNGDFGFATLFGNFAEKVGIISAQRSTTS